MIMEEVVKSGWKTTEFWVLVALSIGELSAALAGALPTKWAAALLTISGVAYKASRALVKFNSTSSTYGKGSQ